MAEGVVLGSGGWVLLLGWPAVLAAVVAFSLAVARRSRTAAIAGCLLAGPMFSYLSLAPRFHWIAPVAFGLLCILAWRVKRSGRLAVFLLALPAMILVAWLAYAVLTQ